MHATAKWMSIAAARLSVPCANYASLEQMLQPSLQRVDSCSLSTTISVGFFLLNDRRFALWIGKRALDLELSDDAFAKSRRCTHSSNLRPSFDALRHTSTEHTPAEFQVSVTEFNLKDKAHFYRARASCWTSSPAIYMRQNGSMLSIFSKSD